MPYIVIVYAVKPYPSFLSNYAGTEHWSSMRLTDRGFAQRHKINTTQKE